MASNELNKQMMWLIKIVSNRDFSNKDRDFIAELVSEEARKMRGDYSFIIHDIVESKRYSNILIEGTKSALANLLSVIKDNILYKITYRRHTL